MNTSDLIKKLKNGDEWAFAELFALHRESVFGCALAILKDPTLAEDITQETFMKLWQSRHKIQEESVLIHFLMEITRNKCFDQIRGEETNRRTMGEYGYRQQHLKNEPENLYDQKYQLSLLVAAVNNLPDDVRETFIMSYLQDKGNIQISNELNVKHGTTRNRISRALRAIRNFLDKSE